MAWSPDGRALASGSNDETVRIWSASRGRQRLKLEGHADIVCSVAWSPDSQAIATGSRDRTVRIWGARRGTHRRTLEGHTDCVRAVAWCPDMLSLASASDDNTICIWRVQNGKLARTLDGHDGKVASLAWSQNTHLLASGSADTTIRLWDTRRGKLRRTLAGHGDAVTSITWSPDGNALVSGSADQTIRIWDAKTGRLLTLLEGHIDAVTAVAFSHDGLLLGSKSNDGTVMLWRYDVGVYVAILDEPRINTHPSAVGPIAFHPSRPVLATLGEQDRAIRIWRLDDNLLLSAVPHLESVHYTTAKIALVGDTGVGKTGLGWRLAHGVFKEQTSTHGQQFWIIDDLSFLRPDGTECEAVLWDLAGQPDYRLVHSLFLDDVDLALVLFDASNRESPLSGVEFWLKQLSHGRGKAPHTLLVGARIDRGTPTLTAADLAEYCRSRDITGGYVATSALTGQGLADLMDRIKGQVKWEKIPATVTTRTFKRIKEHVLSLKERAQPDVFLVTPESLSQRLQDTDADWEFTDREMMTTVRHLENHGYVTILRRSSGKEVVLLFPDLLVNLASSLVLEARRNPRGLGVLEEDVLLQGGYGFQELSGLSEEERETLLDAVAAMFLEHNLCFRETFNERAFLVFPSLINEKRPRRGVADVVDDVSYHVTGSVENVYAAMVVLLGYTNTFTRTNQWQNHAQYELGEDEICGFRQIADREGEIELVLFYKANLPENVRLLFQGNFERFLTRRQVSIRRYPPVSCPQCGERQERSVVIKQMDRGRGFVFCSECGRKMALPKPDEAVKIPYADRDALKREQAVARRRTAFEAALVRIKGLVRDRGDEAEPPSCFVSYAWGIEEHERWVYALAKDLRNAGVQVVFDRWHNPPGASITKFVDRIASSDYIVVVGTPQYLEKYNTEETDPVGDAELRLINTRLRKRARERKRVIPLLLEGSPRESFPPLFEDSVHIDFRVEREYFARIFDLILTLHGISFDQPGLDELRDSMC